MNSSMCAADDFMRNQSLQKVICFISKTKVCKKNWYTPAIQPDFGKYREKVKLLLVVCGIPPVKQIITYYIDALKVFRITLNLSWENTLLYINHHISVQL